MDDFINYVMSNDESELAKVKAELAFALHCLEREIGICAQTQEQLNQALAKIAALERE